MSIEETEFETECTTECGFGVSVEENADCLPGGAGCGLAFLTIAGESCFHDKDMMEVTRAFNAIVDKLPEDPNGRVPSFIHTSNGTLLAWVDHSGQSGEYVVTDKSDPAEIARILKIKTKSAVKGTYG